MENLLLHNPHAGEILKYEFLEELELSAPSLAVAIGVPDFTIQDMLNARSPVTADLDLRLCRYFRLSEGYFLRLQNAYQLLDAKRKLGETLDRIVPHAALSTLDAN